MWLQACRKRARQGDKKTRKKGEEKSARSKRKGAARAGSIWQICHVHVAGKRDSDDDDDDDEDEEEAITLQRNTSVICWFCSSIQEQEEEEEEKKEAQCLRCSFDRLLILCTQHLSRMRTMMMKKRLVGMLLFSSSCSESI